MGNVVRSGARRRPSYMLSRRGEKLYCYTYERVGGRVRRIYRGAGDAAVEAARRQHELRFEREAEREEARRGEREHAEATDALEEFSGLLDLATRAVLVGMGYHQHARGEWRLRRHGRDEERAEDVHGGPAGDPGPGLEG
jgi:hypothetical protein